VVCFIHSFIHYHFDAHPSAWLSPSESPAAAAAAAAVDEIYCFFACQLMSCPFWHSGIHSIHSPSPKWMALSLVSPAGHARTMNKEQEQQQQSHSFLIFPEKP
jgi:hypothetical protein